MKQSLFKLSELLAEVAIFFPRDTACFFKRTTGNLTAKLWLFGPDFGKYFLESE
jgi:hypothetical protein